VWGAGFRGQLGRSNLGDSAAPVRVTLPGRAVTAAAGRYHTLVLLAGGDVWGFGDNGSCQLGLSPLVYPRTDEPVDLGLHDMLAVAAGEYHSLAVLADHGAVGWGDDAGGQLGRGDLVRAHYDCDAASLSVSNVRLVTGGASSTVLVADDNRIASDGSSD
jgi:alpha-tubulin suppressor-like RCC1 family protein